MPVTAFLVAEIVNKLVLKQPMVMPLCGLFQILDPIALKADLFRSLLLLHGQPPLLNVLAGIILKTAPLLGSTPETLAGVVFGASGLATALLLFYAVASWTRSHLLASLGVVLYFINPAYYGGSFAGTGRNYFFYEFLLQPVLLFLCLSASVWLKNAGFRAGLAFVIGAAIVVNTRTLFHPLLWGGVVTIAVLAPHARRHAKTVAALGALALCLFSAWAIKNYVLFGVFTASTWDGFNLDRDFAPLPKPLSDIDLSGPWPDATNLLSRFPRIASWPRQSLAVVTSGAKSCGGANWNNLYMVVTRNDAVARGLAARRDLVHDLNHVLLMYQYTTRPMYIQPYLGQAFGLYPDQFTGYLWVYDRLFFFPLSNRTNERNTLHWNILNVLILPMLILGTTLLIFYSPGDRILLSVTLYTAFFPIISACLSDGFEGNRMRHSTYPLMILLALLLASAGYHALRSRATPRLLSSLRADMPIRAWIALLLFLAAAFHTRIRETWERDRSLFSKRPEDPVTQLEHRLSTFDPWLAHVARVGFESDRPPEDGLAALQHFQVQYALAPRVLEIPGSGQRWLILWTRNSESLRRLTSSQRLRIVHDAGDGLVLVEAEK